MFILVEEYDGTSRIIKTRDIKGASSNRSYDGIKHFLSFYDDRSSLQISLSPEDFFEKYMDQLNNKEEN